MDSLSRFSPLPEIFNNPGHDRNNDDRHDHQRKIISHHRDIAEKITCKCERKYPENSPGNIIDKKFAVGHAADAGNKRRKGADDRNEAGNDNGLPAVPFIKLMGAFQMLLLKKRESS